MRSAFSIARFALSGGICLYCALAWSEAQPTYPVYTGTLVMAGKVTAQTCSVDAGSAEQTIQMGTINNGDFDGAGSYSPSVPFHIRLLKCDTQIGKMALVGFDGETAPDDRQVLRVHGNDNVVAGGVGLTIFDADGKLMIPGRASLSRKTLRDGETQLDFSARYRATQSQVTGGEASAVAWFSVVYQ